MESLAKKYEEKYKQVAELASKLAVEEAAFRDVQVFAFLPLIKIKISLHIFSVLSSVSFAFHPLDLSYLLS